MTYIIRNFKPEDYQIVRDWGNNIHWNLGTHQHQAFRLLDKKTFWIGQLDGKPIASISVAQYDQNYAFIGLYLCVPEQQKKGYAFKVWKQAMKHITAKTIALEGSQDQQANYMKEGFESHHRTISFIVNGTNKPYNSQNLVSCQDLEFQQLVQFDKKQFAAERKEFLKQWIHLPGTKSIAFLRNRQIQGYGVLRLSGDGYRLGPLYANSYQVAQQILKHLIGEVAVQVEVTIDVPEINENAMKLAKNWNMKEDCFYYRMYKTESSNLYLPETVYGTTSLELG